jgi:hypothetical protein
VEPSFVLAIREAVRGTARGTSLEHTVSAGDRPRRVVRTSQQVTNVRLTPPGAGEPVNLAAVPVEGRPTDDQGPAVAIELPDTRRAGLYRLTWDEGPLGTQQDLFAANPDPRESGLERISEKDLRTMLNPLALEITSVRGDGVDAFSASGQEIWRQVAWGLLGLLLLEPLLAAWVGRSR